MHYRDEIKKRAMELCEEDTPSEVSKKLSKEFEGERTPCEKTISRWWDEKQHGRKPIKQLGTKRAITYDPTTHHAYLVSVTSTLLSNDLHTVKPIQSDNSYFEYQIGAGASQGITRKQLVKLVQDNFDMAFDLVYDEDLYIYFLPHLKAVIPEIESQGLESFIQEDPYRIVDILRNLERGGKFKGTCPVCE